MSLRDPARHVARLDARDLALLAEPSTLDASLVAGAVLEPSETRPAREASSPLRAAYDFGVAISPAGPGRRKSLVTAAKIGLGLATSHDSRAMVSLRVALLDAVASDVALESLLAHKELSLGVRLELLELARARSPRATRALIFRHFDMLTRSGREADEVLGAMECAGALETGTLAAWQELRRALGERGAARFWRELAAAWWEKFRRPAGKRLLEACAKAVVAGHLPHDGRAAVERLAQAIAGWQSRGMFELLRHGDDSDLEWAALATDPTPGRALPAKWWRTQARRVYGEIGPVDASLVYDFSRRLSPRRSDTARRLLAGAAPTEALEKPVGMGDKLRLRFLDKRADTLVHLRLADAAPCCFSTDSWAFEDGMHTSRWLLRLFKDPLSFGLHIEKDGVPLGFVFGGFGIADEPLLLLNGVYLERQNRTLRFAVLEGLERSLARPLGIRCLGVAGRFGGAGSFPESYRRERHRAIRLRALRGFDGELEREVYDDISDWVNQPTELDLHWRRLES